jgi:dephospho-CoA kinase
VHRRRPRLPRADSARPPLWERLRSRFGNDIVADSGQIDRRALGAIVFSDPKKLAELDEITHRVVIDEVLRRRDVSLRPVVAIEAVKLIESGLAAHCDQVWLVEASTSARRARLMERNGLSAEEADRRIAAHSPAPPTPGRYGHRRRQLGDAGAVEGRACKAGGTIWSPAT